MNTPSNLDRCIQLYDEYLDNLRSGKLDPERFMDLFCGNLHKILSFIRSRTLTTSEAFKLLMYVRNNHAIMAYEIDPKILRFYPKLKKYEYFMS